MKDKIKTLMIVDQDTQMSGAYLVVPQVPMVQLCLVRGWVGGASTAGASRADGAHGALPAAQTGGGGGRGLEDDATLRGLNVAQDLQRQSAIIRWYGAFIC